MRLRRSDDRAAEAVLELLERESERASESALMLSLRGELAFYRAQWELAGGYFCQLWRAAVSGKDGVDIDAVARRLTQLEERIGPEGFAELYAEHAEATPTPAALGLMYANGAVAA